MVDQAILLKKVGLLRAYVADVRSRLPLDPAGFVADADLHDLVAFHLLLAVQSAIDIATHNIACEGLGVPSSHREAFESLASTRIDHDLAARVADAAALRYFSEIATVQRRNGGGAGTAGIRLFGDRNGAAAQRCWGGDAGHTAFRDRNGAAAQRWWRRGSTDEARRAPTGYRCKALTISQILR